MSGKASSSSSVLEKKAFFEGLGHQLYQQQQQNASTMTSPRSLPSTPRSNTTTNLTWESTPNSSSQTVCSQNDTEAIATNNNHQREPTALEEEPTEPMLTTSSMNEMSNVEQTTTTTIPELQQQQPQQQEEEHSSSSTAHLEKERRVHFKQDEIQQEREAKTNVMVSSENNEIISNHTNDHGIEIPNTSINNIQLEDHSEDSLHTNNHNNTHESSTNSNIPSHLESTPTSSSSNNGVSGNNTTTSGSTSNNVKTTWNASPFMATSSSIPSETSRLLTFTNAVNESNSSTCVHSPNGGSISPPQPSFAVNPLSDPSVMTRTLKDFKIVKKIGGGNEGAVFFAELKNPLTDEDPNVAIKLVICDDPQEVESTRNELQFLLTLLQENIVKHYYIFEEKKKGVMNEQTRFYIVMEYCADGSLELEINKRQREQRPFETELVKRWTRQICQCMNYMHSQSIVHRDIKPDNILLAKNKQFIKVCDFGFTRKDKKLMTTIMGTMKYIAPEMLDSRVYDESVDIWSLGVLLFQLICLYTQAEIPDLILEIRNNPDYIRERLKDHDEVLVQIIERCLKIDPVDRPEAKDIIELIDKQESIDSSFQQQETPVNIPKNTDNFQDNDVKELAKLLDQLERARLLKIKDPLKAIELDRAREFWRANGWANQKEVLWVDFREAYQKHALDFNKIPKNAERGFKKMITANQEFDVYSNDDDKTGIVTVLSYNNLVRRAGFPFNLDVLDLIQNCLVLGEYDWNIEKYNKPMDPQSYAHAERQYLNMILQNEKLFVDPISQETLSVDDHCVSLHLLQHGKDWIDEFIGVGANTLSNVTMTSATSFSDEKEYENHRRIHLIEMFSEGHAIQNEEKEKQSDVENFNAKQNLLHENGDEFITSLPSNCLRFMLLSNASCGKTCMLKMVMSRLVKNRMQQRETSGEKVLIPLLVPAGLFASLTNEAEFFIKCIRASAGGSIGNSGNTVRYLDTLEHFLLTAIKEQRVLFIFDGVDEIASPQQKKRFLQSLMEFFPPQEEVPDSNGLILSSRLGGIEADVKTRKFFSSFTAASIQNLTFDIQKRIAQKRNVNNEAFLSSIKGKYRELAKTPILLSLIIEEFKIKGSLPEVRSKIYYNALDTITKLHYSKLVGDQQRVPKMQKTLIEFLRKVSIFLHKLRRLTFSTEDFTHSLELARNLCTGPNDDKKLAFMSLAEGDFASKGDDWIFNAVANPEFQKQWEALKKRIDSGKFPLIVSTGDGKYRFSHTSFQEYLVASHWADATHVSDFRIRSTGPFAKNKLEYFKERIRQLVVDPFYKETFLFCAAEMSRSDFEEFIKFLMNKLFKHNIGLVDSIIYNMIMERPKSEHGEYTKIMKPLRNDERVSIIVKGLIHESEDLRKMALCRSFMFNELFDKIGDGLLNHIHDNENTLQALSLVIPKGEQKYVKILLEKLSNISDIQVKRRICLCIGKISDKGDSMVVNMLLNIIHNTPRERSNISLIEACVDSVCRVGEKGDSNIINALIPMLEDYNFRRIASIGLGMIANTGDKQVISALTKVANKCQEACLCLGKLAEKGDMEIIDTLLDCLKENSFDDLIVNEAISSVVIPDLLPVIQDRLLEMLLNERKSISYRVAMALGPISQRKNYGLVRSLVDMLYTVKPKDRIICALGFSSPKEDSEIIHELLKQLSNKQSNYVFREQSALALAHLAKKGDERVIDELCKRLHTDQEEVIVACTTALEKITNPNNQKVLNMYVELLKHTDIGVVEVSVRYLGRKCERGSESKLIVKHLMERLENRESPEVVRALCAEALGYVASFNDERVIKCCLNIITEEGKSMTVLRLFCLKAIGMLKSVKQDDYVTSTLFEYIVNLSTTNMDLDSKKFIIHATFIISLFCDLKSMVDRLKNKNYKSHKHLIFDIVVKGIRFIRLFNQSYRLDDESVLLLQKQDDLEASFILIENALMEGGVVDVNN
ncbi:hypothetical protein C9374_000651 [Naegleria lovaniensis]|uniref:Protein kinase domain-containing protein n=1 Tax=Naegleria lovaniensis TaxID=51637 RepID=A0AA88GWS4_NAELO|nr:uncharacterized protein C9374_000651 [Naegleria lovaniensis]KAG2388487.1 hypothetical protein C9374_000651 [Naegleria lovaniensis]